MKQINIPFQLGMEYENWEFDLEILPDRLEGYDSYLYIGKEFNYFMNYPTDKTELIFILDRLVAVILTFLNIKVKDFKQFYDRLQIEFKNNNLSQNNEAIKTLLIADNENTIYFLYGVSNLIYAVFPLHNKAYF
ncbi:hypothetical protein ETU10_08720 [Apibacter muscae]|uniref:hypothetical protein n=1 Tax=Apibacter muscae TaxID=2509004 RepID=UPI0011ABDCBF|nr:hypothetical protein [Apibacter muscae]TWP23168.1 hypothetical protein ETU10_08720 [Apibacter muscae]